MSAAVRSRTGNGAYGYSADVSWAKLPEEVKLGYTHGIVTDSQDHVYVFHTGSPSILELDSDGRYIRGWGEYGDGAHGFLLNKEQAGEFLYLTDIQRGEMVKMALDGRVLLTLGTPDLPDVYGEDRTYRPTDVAVAPNGDIYVTDGYGQSWIHQYDASGSYIRSWGGKGSGEGELNCPHGISVDVRSGEPEIYVADRGNHRVQVFTPYGAFKRMFDHDMDMPCSFYFFEDKFVFPDLNSRVTIFDRDDRLLVHLGEDQQAYKQQGWPNLPKSYYREGRFSSPHGVCVDSAGSIYVSEWIHDGRITKLVPLN